VYLADQFPHAPWMPVLQGWTMADYLRCVAMYSEARVDLESMPVVGLGSVCRRQSTPEIGAIVATLAGLGLKLHAFGVKLGGLQRYGHLLSSSDSMAWSFAARYAPPMPGHLHRHCNNCLTYALAWRQRVVNSL
jgi:hypothetical protein